MSDSIKKYYELVEEGVISESSNLDKTVKQGKLLDRLMNHPEYTEIELVETVVAIARHYKDAKPELILQMAKDELSVKKVCD
jgi:hypothetical protein